MPILQNAKKALRVSKRKAIKNSRVRSMMKTMMDKLKKTPTGENLAAAYSAIDTAVKNNLVPKNRAGRMKSNLSKLTKPVVETAQPKKAAAKKTTKKSTKKATEKKTTKKAAKK